MGVSEIDVGACIRAYRKKNKLSLKELSQLTGIAASNLSAIELNKSSPTLSTLLKLADAFGVKVGAFLDDAIYAQAYSCRREDATRTGETDPDRDVVCLTGRVPLASVDVSILTLKNPRKSLVLAHRPCDRFLYCTRGQAKATVNGKVFGLSPGEGLHVVAGVKTELMPEGAGEAELLDIYSRVS